MTMTFFLHDSIQPNAPVDMIGRGAAVPQRARMSGEFPLLLGKLRMPINEKFVERPRLSALLERSMTQFPATLISGRAGTGKTACAASFAATLDNTGWYTVETTDQDWNSFARYFSCCLFGAGFRPAKPLDDERYEPQNAIAKFLVRHFMGTQKEASRSNSLIVLDDVHHIFDAEWFGEFFKLLLYSLPPSAHLMMLCRSKPPSPLWRLRSKQVLNVIDEEQLAFTTDETAELLGMYGQHEIGPESARVEAFGRVAKLIEIANEGREY